MQYPCYFYVSLDSLVKNKPALKVSYLQSPEILQFRASKAARRTDMRHFYQKLCGFHDGIEKTLCQLYTRVSLEVLGALGNIPPGLWTEENSRHLL